MQSIDIHWFEIVLKPNEMYTLQQNEYANCNSTKQTQSKSQQRTNNFGRWSLIATKSSTTSASSTTPAKASSSTSSRTSSKASSASAAHSVYILAWSRLISSLESSIPRLFARAIVDSCFNYRIYLFQFRKQQSMVKYNRSTSRWHLTQEDRARDFYSRIFDWRRWWFVWWRRNDDDGRSFLRPSVLLLLTPTSFLRENQGPGYELKPQCIKVTPTCSLACFCRTNQYVNWQYTQSWLCLRL